MVAMMKYISRLSLASAATLLLLTAAGCQPKASDDGETAADSSGPQVSEVPLRVKLVATVDDVDSIRRTWLAQSDQPIEMEVLTAAELLGKKELKADVIVYPARLLCTLVEQGWVNRLPATMTEEDEGLSAVNTEAFQCNIGEQPYALSLGCSTPIFLHSDALNVPASSSGDNPKWSVLLEQLRRVDAIKIDNSEVDQDALVDRYFAILATLLDRTAKFGTLFDLKSLRPLLDQPEYVQAAEILTRIAQQTEDGLLAVGSHDAVWTAVQGSELPVLSIADQLAISSESKRRKGAKILASTPAGQSPLSEAVTGQWNLGGGLVASIASNCRQSSQARAFVTWLGEDDTRGAIAPHVRGVSVTTPVFGIESLSWQAQVKGRSAVNMTNVPFEPRLPATQDYRSVLAEQLLRVLVGELPADQALTQTVQQWEAISAGKPNQQFEYEKSLGLVF